MAAGHSSGVAGGGSVLESVLERFIIQCAIIVLLCKLLAYPLKRWLRQPSVIAEIIAGILLGPSVLSRIPGFTENIFPTPSLPFLKLFADFGLIYFLFLIGMEVDFASFKNNWKTSVAIASSAMVLPFGLGCAITPALRNTFYPEVPIGPFLLFIGTSLSITAFPVLARILLETKMLNSVVGSTTLYAAAMGDVAAWILLALCIAIANAGSPLIVLWIILMSIGYCVFMFIPVRLLLDRICRPRGAHKKEDGAHESSAHEEDEQPVNPLIITMLLIAALVSGWVTEWIGIHSIFGGFLMGLVTPRNVTEQLTKKIEDLIVILFLPLYFAYSGLRTSFGLLDDGTVWAYTVLIIVCACAGKIIPATIAARLRGLKWLDAGILGVLMNTRGLVELIVLNIGLDAGVLEGRLFTALVLMAVFTTFTTVPVVNLLERFRPKQGPYERRDESNDYRIMLGIRTQQQAHGLVIVAELLHRNSRHVPSLSQAASATNLANSAPSHAKPKMSIERLVEDRPFLPRKQGCRLYGLSMREVSERPSHYINFRADKDRLIRALKEHARTFQLSLKPLFAPVINHEDVIREIRNSARTKRIDLSVASVPGTLFDLKTTNPRLSFIRGFFEEVPSDVLLLAEMRIEFMVRIQRVMVVFTGSPSDAYLLKLLRRFANTVPCQVVLAPAPDESAARRRTSSARSRGASFLSKWSLRSIPTYGGDGNESRSGRTPTQNISRSPPPEVSRASLTASHEIVVGEEIRVPATPLARSLLQDTPDYSSDSSDDGTDRPTSPAQPHGKSEETAALSASQERVASDPDAARRRASLQTSGEKGRDGMVTSIDEELPSPPVSPTAVRIVVPSGEAEPRPALVVPGLSELVAQFGNEWISVSDVSQSETTFGHSLELSLKSDEPSLVVVGYWATEVEGRAMNAELEEFISTFPGLNCGGVAVVRAADTLPRDETESAPRASTSSTNEVELPQI
eukprot:TRINITY_DN445_c0_g2_i2.p1 TRINITY_DN445_c0_g2~~TRINITY_DN445_c0_g2_i2.p1  ORF type:complete len:969 (-),score=404.50 TRINITY_DN445_c0_g2_i2:718-3624(-)